MLINQKDKEGLIAYLSHMLRAGDQWVAYDDVKDEPNAGEVVTFLNLNAAGRYCELHSWFNDEGEMVDYVFQPILNVVNKLRVDGKPQKSSADYRKLGDIVKRFSISPYDDDTYIVEALANGLYHPVNVKQAVLPWQDIESYSVIEHYCPRRFRYEVGQTTTGHSGFPNYYDAQKCFQQLMEKYACISGQPDLNLIGKIKGQEVAYDMDDFPQPGTGILFKCAISTCYSFDDVRYEVEVINAPDKAIEIVQQKIAKFNWQTSTLEFFDGALRKVPGNAKIDFMDFHKMWSKSIGVLDGQKLVNVSSGETNNEGLGVA